MNILLFDLTMLCLTFKRKGINKKSFHPSNHLRNTLECYSFLSCIFIFFSFLISFFIIWKTINVIFQFYYHLDIIEFWIQFYFQFDSIVQAKHSNGNNLSVIFSSIVNILIIFSFYEQNMTYILSF